MGVCRWRHPQRRVCLERHTSIIRWTLGTHAPGTRRHIKAALKLGATMEEIMEVLKLAMGEFRFSPGGDSQAFIDA
jgi:hypothetical protein